MPHITIHYLARDLSGVDLGALSDSITEAVSTRMSVNASVISVSVAPTRESEWEAVLASANGAGDFIRVPGYPTNLHATRIEAT